MTLELSDSYLCLLLLVKAVFLPPVLPGVKPTWNQVFWAAFRINFFVDMIASALSLCFAISQWRIYSVCCSQRTTPKCQKSIFLKAQIKPSWFCLLLRNHDTSKNWGEILSPIHTQIKHFFIIKCCLLNSGAVICIILHFLLKAPWNLCCKNREISWPANWILCYYHVNSRIYC